MVNDKDKSTQTSQQSSAKPLTQRQQDAIVSRISARLGRPAVVVRDHTHHDWAIGDGPITNKGVANWGD